MVEMFVFKIGFDADRRGVIILADASEERFLPIVIGPFEAHAIAVAGQSIHHRPLTHQLTNSIITTLGYRLEKMEIIKLEDQVFYALLHVRNGEARFEIDARPSDAIALALGAEVPIYVAQDVLEQAAVLSEDAVQQEKEELRDLLAGIPLEDDTPDEK